MRMGGLMSLFPVFTPLNACVLLAKNQDIRVLDKGVPQAHEDVRQRDPVPIHG